MIPNHTLHSPPEEMMASPRTDTPEKERFTPHWDATIEQFIDDIKKSGFQHVYNDTVTSINHPLYRYVALQFDGWSITLRNDGVWFPTDTCGG